MPDLYKDLGETEIAERQVDQSSMQNDPNNCNNGTYNYNLHSGTACRLKWDCEYSKTYLGIKINMKIA